MSIDFTAGQFLQSDSAPISGFPFTIAGWVNRDSGFNLFNLGIGGNNYAFWSSDTVLRVVLGGAQIDVIITGGATGNWLPFVIWADSATSWGAQLDGVTATSTTSIAGMSFTGNLQLFRYGTDGSNDQDGQLTRLAVWDGYAFTSGDRTSWESGVVPTSISSGNLASWLEFDNSGDLEETEAGSIVWSITGAAAFTASEPAGLDPAVNNETLDGSLASVSSLSGVLDLSPALGGVVAATSAITGDIDLQPQLSGSLGSISAASADLSLAVQLDGSVAAASSFAGAVALNLGLSGSVDGVSSFSGELEVAPDLNGSINASSSLSGDLSFAIALDGALAGVSALSGDLTTFGISSLSIASPEPGQAVVINLTDAENASGKSVTLGGQTLALDSQDINSITLTWPSLHLLPGGLSYSQALVLEVTDGTQTAQTNVTTQPQTGFDAFTITALNGIYADDLGLAVGDEHYGSFTVGAGIIATDGQVTVSTHPATYTYYVNVQSEGEWAGPGVETFEAVVVLAGTLAGVSAFSGDLDLAIGLSGSVDSTSVLAGNLSVSESDLDGTVAAQSALTGDLQLGVGLDASLSAQSGMSGNLSLPQALTGTLSAVTQLSGDLQSGDVELDGVLISQSSFIGNLSGVSGGTAPVTIRLDGVFQPTKTLTGVWLN